MTRYLKGAALALVASAASAHATTIVLDFEGVNATYPSAFATVGGFYNGGVSGDGMTGTNHGVEFTGNALGICLNTVGTTCSNTSRGGSGNPASALGGLFFVTGAETYMNVAAGFDIGFSFFYTAVNQAGSVDVYDGLNGTGAILASLALPQTSSTCDVSYGAAFCPFTATSVGFAGIARSVAFGGVADQIVFDDVTFGSLTAGGAEVPLPAALPLMAAAMGGLGLLARRRRA